MQEEEERDQALQAKASLAIPLVPETEDDRRLAALLKFHTLDCAWGASGPGGLGGQRWGSSATSGPWQARAEGSFGHPSLSSLPTPSLRGQAETQADRDHQPLLVPLRPRTRPQQQQSRQCPEEAGPEPQISTSLLPHHCRGPGHRAAAVPGGLREPPAHNGDPQVWGAMGARGEHPGWAHIPPRLLSGDGRDPQEQGASGAGGEKSGQAPVPTRLLSGGHATPVHPQRLSCG